MFKVTSTTGSLAVDRGGRATGRELTGKTYSRHRLLDRARDAARALRSDAHGRVPAVVVDERSGEIVG